MQRSRSVYTIQLPHQKGTFHSIALRPSQPHPIVTVVFAFSPGEFSLFVLLRGVVPDSPSVTRVIDTARAASGVA